MNKKKLGYLGVLIILSISVIGLFVLATGWDLSKESHSTLYTDYISARSGVSLSIMDMIHARAEVPWTTSNIPVSFAVGGQQAIGFDGPGSGVGTRAIYSHNQKLHFTHSSDTALTGTSGAAVHDMVIDANGNIGIGTVNPSTKLEVIGEVKITNTNTGSSQGTSLCIGSDNKICKCGQCS